jgi:hypothetical protein
MLCETPFCNYKLNLLATNIVTKTITAFYTYTTFIVTCLRRYSSVPCSLAVGHLGQLVNYIIAPSTVEML